MSTSYRCRQCGAYHEGPPLSYGAEAPYLWYTIPEEEREHRCLLSSDQCIIDNEFFFVIGNVDIPTVGSDQLFSWSVWVSLSPENFDRMAKLWNTSGRESESPYFGWFSTELPLYQPSTLNLKTNVHTNPVGVRPYVELEPTDHPLAVEQREGITLERVQEIAETLLHGQEYFED